jgi:osmotically-inducible protein OsmY
MKTDSQLHKDVVDELTWEPRVREQEIGVAAKEGVVTLTGFVESYAQKLAAEKAVKRVAGVRAYADELQVKLRADLARTDTDIAHAAANALDWDVDVPDTVTARVVNGWITLEGSTTWQYQKQAAERAVLDERVELVVDREAERVEVRRADAHEVAVEDARLCVHHRARPLPDAHAAGEERGVVAAREPEHPRVVVATRHEQPHVDAVARRA